MRTKAIGAFLGLVLLALSAAFSPAGVAAAVQPLDDCEFGMCGKIYNAGSTYTLVAASLDKTGGSCPPYGTCGTCAVPPNTNSTRSACSRVFKDTDVFTYDSTAFRYNGTRYNAHTYVKFDSGVTVWCYDAGSDIPNCYS